MAREDVSNRRSLTPEFAMHGIVYQETRVTKSGMAYGCYRWTHCDEKGLPVGRRSDAFSSIEAAKKAALQDFCIIKEVVLDTIEIPDKP